MKYNPSDRVQKYIVVGRKNTVFNDDGDDRVKLISEVYKLKANTQIRGEWYEYERGYYREIGKGGRGTDCGLEEGNMYPCVDGTLGDFVDCNFVNDNTESNEIKTVKTFANKKFLNRNRETSYHEEINIGVDENGNTIVLDDDDE